MEIRKIVALDGPNVWAPLPVLEVWVDLGPVRNIGSAGLASFGRRVTECLPSIAAGAGFPSLAHAFQSVLSELQTLAGNEVRFGETRQTSEPGVYQVAVSYQEEAVVRACLATSLEVCRAALEGKPFAVGSELERLRELADRVCLGPS